MKPKVYIETTIVSYLTAWRSPQLVMAANQETTRNWWDEERGRFELFISELVLQEASAGDSDAANRLRCSQQTPMQPTGDWHPSRIWSCCRCLTE